MLRRDVGQWRSPFFNVMLETLGVMSTHTPFERGYLQMPTYYLVRSAVHFGTLTALLV